LGDWRADGVVGVAFIVQALVYGFSNDPHGPIGVLYAFAFSNLDNAFMGLVVLIASILNQGKEGWHRYWRHPFYYGNAIMLVLIPSIALLFRVVTSFRPESNFLAGVESGMMDIDSVGAAIIFLVSTRFLNKPVPRVDDDLLGAFRKIIRKG
jgi:hypothetical protein